jgi:hypothetical protein
MVVAFVMAELLIFSPAVVVTPTADIDPLAVMFPEPMVTLPPSPVPIVAVVALRLLVNCDIDDIKIEVMFDDCIVDASIVDAPTML